MNLVVFVSLKSVVGKNRSLIARESRSSVGSFIAFEHTPMVQI
jgi:hypothetical protein